MRQPTASNEAQRTYERAQTAWLWASSDSVYLQTTGVIGQAGKFVADTLRDIGDAAKEIVSDGRAEGKVGIVSLNIEADCLLTGSLSQFRLRDNTPYASSF